MENTRLFQSLTHRQLPEVNTKFSDLEGDVSCLNLSINTANLPPPQIKYSIK